MNQDSKTPGGQTAFSRRYAAVCKWALNISYLFLSHANFVTKVRNLGKLWLKLLLKQYEPRERSEKRQRKEDIPPYPFPGEGGYEVKMMVMD